MKAHWSGDITQEISTLKNYIVCRSNPVVCVNSVIGMVGQASLCTSC